MNKKLYFLLGFCIIILIAILLGIIIYSNFKYPQNKEIPLPFFKEIPLEKY